MTKPDFNWALVRSFLAAYDNGSLLGAARALGISQPTIGRHIAELETQLGVVLFERTGRGLLASDTAQHLAESARLMETGALQLAGRVSAAQTRVSGTVRLTASQPVACQLLPPLLADMRRHLPDVQIELVADNAVRNLLRREADIALRSVRPDQATLVARRIGTIELGPYAHRDYLRRHGTPVHAEDLRRHTLVGQDRVDHVIRGFAAQGQPMARTDFALRTDDMIAYAELVRAGAGIGFLAGFSVRGDTDLVRVLPSLKVPPLPLWLAVHREIRTSPRIRAVFDFLVDAVPRVL